MTGKVKMLGETGFGFITPDNGGEDVFFHATALNGIVFQDMTVGLAVKFDVTDGERGQKAMCVEYVD